MFGQLELTGGKDISEEILGQNLQNRLILTTTVM